MGLIIDLTGTVWIADRRSEDVACASLGDELAAGEIFFGHKKGIVRVARVANQSTGYSPEPESLSAVAQALKMAGIDGTDNYDLAFTFRYYHPCQNVCVIKEDDFTCPVFSGPLPVTSNFEGARVGRDASAQAAVVCGLDFR